MNKVPPKGFISVLDAPANSTAWNEFVDKHSPLVFKVARQFSSDPQARRDCYLYIFEKLADDDFHRLKAYRPESAASFTSWLQVVAANLGVDWHRRQHGRYPLLNTVADLSGLDLAVYRLKFEQGLEHSTCLHTLQQQFPELSMDELSGVIARINNLLSPRQHWLLSVRRKEMVSVEENDEVIQVDVASLNLSQPELEMEKKQIRNQIADALKSLNAKQRLLIKLRFNQGLPLKEIARLTGLDDAFHTRYQIRLALEKLQKRLRKT